MIAYSVPVGAAQPPGKASMYTASEKKGWWWYKYKEQEPPKEEKAPEPSPEKKRRLPSLSDYTKEDLQKMHPDDFRVLLDDFRNKALIDTTPANVIEYYRVQDIARRRALAFAAVTSEVMQSHPELNVATMYPNVTPGRNALTRMQSKEIEDKIRGSKDDFALLYFSKTDCDFCVQQESILQFFIDKYSWEVRTLDIDADRGLARMLGVEVAPTLFLVQRDNPNQITISQGVISVSEIEQNLYRSIRYLKGEIGPENFHMYDFHKGGVFDVNAAPEW